MGTWKTSVAKTPATCLEVWSGKHRQTPGGLKRAKSRKRRKKLTKLPLALRCQTQYAQAYDLGVVSNPRKASANWRDIPPEFMLA